MEDMWKWVQQAESRIHTVPSATVVGFGGNLRYLRFSRALSLATAIHVGDLKLLVLTTHSEGGKSSVLNIE